MHIRKFEYLNFIEFNIPRTNVKVQRKVEKVRKPA